VVIIRNWCYDAGFFKSVTFDKPVISVGNLDAGGAGKSPMTEYLIRLLKDNYKLATLSRGYGRKTTGYLEVKANDQAPEIRQSESIPLTPNSLPPTPHPVLTTQIGDEPAQFHRKFPDITVAVCEKRVRGIKKLLPHHDLVLLDDAYQHRAVEPGLSILLFDYNRLKEPQLLLPAGNLREPFSGRWRAQLLVVSKCPPNLKDDEKSAAVRRIGPLPYQELFFTSIVYQPLEHLDGAPGDMTIDQDTTVFLLSGIANAKPLLQYLGGLTPVIIHHNYPDHHQFTLKNIAKLAAEFSACQAEKKLIVTTEKDAQRLDGSWFRSTFPGDVTPPVFVIPIKVEFLDESGQEFDQLITQYVREHTTHHSIH
jgi:tetraacyldisaccharide 4'-kinase